MVSQGGSVLEVAPKGVTVELFVKEGANTPHGCEIYSDDESIYAEMGLWWEGNALCDYDGCFELPLEVLSLLKENGLDVSYAEDTED